MRSDTMASRLLNMIPKEGEVRTSLDRNEHYELRARTDPSEEIIEGGEGWNLPGDFSRPALQK